MSIQEILAALGIKGVVLWGAGILLVLSMLVEVSKIKINPWSALAKWLGRAINADVLAELAEIKQKQAETQEDLDKHVVMDDRRNADGHRTRILHFNNELLRSIDHTKEEFIEVLAEIDAYERYCEEHPEYPNNRAVLAIENIREVYKERMKKHDFLQEGSAERRE